MASLGFKQGLALAVIAVGDWIFWQQQAYGAGLGLFAATLSLAALLARRAIWRDRVAMAFWVASLVFAGALALDPSLLAWLLFGGSLGIAILKPRTGPFDDAWRWFQRLVWQTISSSVLPLLDMANVSGLAAKRRRLGRPFKRTSPRAMLSTLALPLIGTAIFLLLFAEANPVIQQWIDSNLSLGEFAPQRLVLWGLLLLFAWNALRPRLARYLIPSFDGTGDVRIPGVNLASVTLSLMLFNALFALQNAMDAAWLWGLAPLPADMSLADYAHRGAYPLIVTALLAGLFVLVTLRPGSTTAADKRVRALVILWVAQNLLLVASSALRTVDYIEAYSLTMLRLAALEWMLLVALGLGFILWRVIAGRSGPWLINANAGALVMLLSVAAFVDHGAIIARWNATHAREVGGKGVQMDLCYMSGLGASALVPLAELEARPGLDPAFRERVVATRLKVENAVVNWDHDGFWSWRSRAHLAEAQALVASRPTVPVPLGVRDCHGRPLPIPVARDGGPVMGDTPPVEPVVQPVTKPSPAPALTREGGR